MIILSSTNFFLNALTNIFIVKTRQSFSGDYLQAAEQSRLLIFFFTVISSYFSNFLGISAF